MVHMRVITTIQTAVLSLLDQSLQYLNLAEEDGIELGMRQKVTVWAPVVQGMSKTELLKIGYSILGDKVFDTWSCYSNGIKIKGNYLHCGSCESCINRKAAIRNAGIEDQTHYARNE